MLIKVQGPNRASLGVSELSFMADKFSPEKRSWVMSRILGENTTPERRTRSVLHRLGFRFRLHRKDLPGKPDIVLPGRKCVVFVHGCFWHGHDCPRAALPATNREFWETKIGKNYDRDLRIRNELRKAGWKVFTVWQCETKDDVVLSKKLSRYLRGTDSQSKFKPNSFSLRKVNTSI
jgi:DNA mismatch endonuclease (patch repair protein)